MKNPNSTACTTCTSTNCVCIVSGSAKHIQDDTENSILQGHSPVDHSAISVTERGDLRGMILTICSWGDLGLYCVAGSSCLSSLHSKSDLVYRPHKIEQGRQVLSPHLPTSPLICRLWAHLIQKFFILCSQLENCC